MTDMTLSEIDKAAGEAQVKDYFNLLKPRVMSLVVLTAAVGLFAAPGATHPVLAFAAILCIAVGAGASGALNMWWDADIDAIMKRTVNRPLPAGKVEPGEALGIGLGLSIMSVLMLSIFANIQAAIFLAFTIFFYVVIYSMWLKRSTPQNIVIGGAAGAFPPMIGWMCVTGGVSLEGVLMFALIFLWTPPHFWALAIFRNEDYVKAGVPMYPVVKGDRATRFQILAYTVILFPVAMALAFTEVGGPVYFLAALAYNARFVWGAVAIWRRDEATAKADKFKTELRVFLESIGYLFALFIALGVDIALRSLGWAWSGWPVLF
ncbi:heme o synthase [Pontivivens insulae]|uniref:Protoheme IX farnesyltransferase n=1 Tax=Pontivivens insulae TaxID=1639689 RepID=A0A2R8A7M4_9RHOB|nr:heme o synthase [Pontivivens insulae]RED18133.1 protoheme IX farnesyltransferase [Pontivivens insulae]SPF28030.1 Protoheme IX farnesyltransferase [Pontivivens insulae]